MGKSHERLVRREKSRVATHPNVSEVDGRLVKLITSGGMVKREQDRVDHLYLRLC